MVLGTAFALLVGRAAVAAPDAVAAAQPSPTVTEPAPAPPDVFDSGLDPGHGNDPGLWMSWSLLDRSDDRRTGSGSSTTERTAAESSIKAWIAADYLRKAQEAGRSLTGSQLGLIDRAIRSSDDDAAETMYVSLGRDQILTDLDRTCGVTAATSQAGYWSYTQITADDATRILDCVLDKAPTYPNGDRLIDALHHVDADGSFGIPQALGSDIPVAVKNGWTAHSSPGVWNVNCVASWDHYVLAVLTRYPIDRGLDTGAGVCRDVATSVLQALN